MYQDEDTVENRRVYQKQNVSQSTLRGLEAECEVGLSDNFSSTVNITYTYGQNISKNEPMRRIPPLFGRVQLSYRNGSSWWSKIEYMFAGRQERLAAGDKSDARIFVRLVDGVMPSWNTFNIYAGYNYRSVSFSISGQNLLDEPYRVYASGIDAPGRTLGLSVTAKI